MSKQRKLATYVHVDGAVYGPDDDVPADVAKQITNPKAWADGKSDSASGDDGGSSDAAKAIDDMNGKELKAEIAKRNEGRADDVKIAPESQKNDDLLAALKADDALNA
jgi:hypothetical protein